MDSQKKRLSAEVEALAGDLYAVSEFLYQNPEIGYQEFKACEFLSQFLEQTTVYHGCDRIADILVRISIPVNVEADKNVRAPSSDRICTSLRQ